MPYMLETCVYQQFLATNSLETIEGKIQNNAKKNKEDHGELQCKNVIHSTYCVCSSKYLEKLHNVRGKDKYCYFQG